MKSFACALIAGSLLSADLAFACSGADLIQKQKAFSAAVKASFERDPSGDAGRQAKVQAIIARYKDLKETTNGGYAIDMLWQGERRAIGGLQIESGPRRHVAAGSGDVSATPQSRSPLAGGAAPSWGLAASL
jgi:hypothetical protein